MYVIDNLVIGNAKTVEVVDGCAVFKDESGGIVYIAKEFTTIRRSVK